MIMTHATVRVTRDHWVGTVDPFWRVTNLAGKTLAGRFKHAIQALAWARENGHEWADLGTKNWFNASQPYQRIIRTDQDPTRNA